MLEKLKPFLNIGPGDFIKEELEVRGWQQNDLKNIINLSEKHISDLINNKQSITIETARLLSKAFGQSPHYWINLDTNFRLRLDNSLFEDDVEIKAKIYKYMPIKDMIRKGWLPSTETTKELVSEVMNFWGINKLDFSFIDKVLLPNFRKSDAFTQFNHYYALTWFQMAKNSSKLFDVRKYDKSKLSELSEKLSSLSNMQEGIPLLIKELHNTGVKFMVLSHLQKTYTDGASFFDGPNPVIVYTARYDRNHNFWFTVAHEIGHILLHLKNKTDFFIDESDKIKTEFELEADEFAQKILKIPEILRFFGRKSSNIRKGSILTCSAMLDINEALVVGALQYNNKLKRTHLNNFKKRVSNLIPQCYFL